MKIILGLEIHGTLQFPEWRGLALVRRLDELI